MLALWASSNYRLDVDVARLAGLAVQGFSRMRGIGACGASPDSPDKEKTATSSQRRSGRGGDSGEFAFETTQPLGRLCNLEKYSIFLDEWPLAPGDVRSRHPTMK